MSCRQGRGSRCRPPRAGPGSSHVDSARPHREPPEAAAGRPWGGGCGQVRACDVRHRGAKDNVQHPTPHTRRRPLRTVVRWGGRSRVWLVRGTLLQTRRALPRRACSDLPSRQAQGGWWGGGGRREGTGGTRRLCSRAGTPSERLAWPRPETGRTHPTSQPAPRRSPPHMRTQHAYVA